MNRLLVIDGYNVIHRIPRLEAKLSISLESSRIALIRLVDTWAEKHRGIDCLIVFDGKDNVGGHKDPDAVSKVRCLFTKTKVDADDEIIRQVREFVGKTSHMTVISDDNYVGNNCRAHGARVQPASFFIDASNQSTHKKQATNLDDKTLDPKAVKDINKELRIKFGLR